LCSGGTAILECEGCGSLVSAGSRNVDHKRDSFTWCPACSPGCAWRYGAVVLKRERAQPPPPELTDPQPVTVLGLSGPAGYAHAPIGVYEGDGHPAIRKAEVDK
jgi:hypothetical protein